MKPATAILILLGVLVFIWPLLTVWIGDYWISNVKSHPYYIYEESAPRITRTILAAFPFIALFVFSFGKLRESDRKTITGILSALILVTAAAICLYLFFLFSTLSHQTRGTNVGTATVMMVSPIFLTLLIFVGGMVGRKFASE